MALTIRHKDGLSELTPFVLDYERRHPEQVRDVRHARRLAFLFAMELVREGEIGVDGRA